MSNSIPFQPFFQSLLSVSDTEMYDFYQFSLILAEKHPEILQNIDRDRDNHALGKKIMRKDVQRYYHEQDKQNAFLEGLDIGEASEPDTELELKQGRDRSISALGMLFLLILRGAWGSITDKTGTERLKDSLSLFAMLPQLKMKTVPKPNTILDNLNAVSNQTRQLILKLQVDGIIEQELDDFNTIYIDSTAVKANSAFPTDIAVLGKLLERIVACNRKLKKFGLEFDEKYVDSRLYKLHKYLVRINLVSGKGAKGRRNEAYRRALKCAQKLTDHCIEQMNILEQDFLVLELDPLKRAQLDKIWFKIAEDIDSALYVIHYAELRTQHGEKLPAREKIISISDQSAAFIEKGNREPVVGYKPQIARSLNGFIAGIIIPEGNQADSKMLEPILEQVIYHTNNTPQKLSVDDGYDSPFINKLIEDGMTVNVSGAKGKRRLGEAYWDSEEVKDLRNYRSAVESGMFTLKHCHQLAHMRRRGIDAVRAEILEKAIAYNFRQILRRQAEMPLAA